MSDSKCCGPPKPKDNVILTPTGPNNILVLGEVLKVSSWLSLHFTGNTYVRCTYCASDFNIMYLMVDGS